MIQLDGEPPVPLDHVVVSADRDAAVSVVAPQAEGIQRGFPPLLLTVAEVERELRLGRTRVYQLLRAGQIPHVRVGERAIRVTREDLHRWIESRQRQRSTY